MFSFLSVFVYYRLRFASTVSALQQYNILSMIGSSTAWFFCFVLLLLRKKKKGFANNTISTHHYGITVPPFFSFPFFALSS
mmetsp:Transcript_44878/g.108905  ORF Transcript_44878/g.108905 Transcript_44878/m.108905 type:complete len:81 (+) Transcript_44878:813-1055(+)